MRTAGDGLRRFFTYRINDGMSQRRGAGFRTGTGTGTTAGSGAGWRPRTTSASQRAARFDFFRRLAFTDRIGFGSK